MANNVKLKANVWMEIISSVKSQSINSNQTTVNIQVKLSNPYGTYTYAGDGPGWRIKYIVKNGDKTLLDTGYITFNYSIGTIYPIDQNFVIDHNADGTSKSDVFSVYIVGEASQGLATTSGHTADTTISIPTIPRASDFTLSGNTIGSAMTMTITRASSNFTHKAWYRLPGQTWQTITGNATTSASFTIPIPSCTYLPDTTSGNVEIEMHTFNGTTLVGKTIKNISVNVPSSVIPTVTANVTQSNTAIQTQFQVFIKDKSDAKFTIVATGAYGSTIKSITTTLLEKTYQGEEITTDILTQSGNHSAIVRATDSRGRISTFVTTIKVVDYSPPKINMFSVERCNQDGTQNASGSYAKAIFNSQISPADEKNTKSHLIRYRRKGTTAWTNLIHNEDVYSLSSNAIASGTDLKYGYEFQYVINDYFSSATYTIVVPSGFFPLTWATDGSYKIGIGKVAEFNGIDFGEMPTINGKSFFDGIKIPQHADLNTYKTAGFFYNPLNAEVSTIKNVPIANAFSLEVLKHTNGGGVRQIFREYRNNAPTTWERNFYQSWGAWVKTITSSTLTDYMKDWIIESGTNYKKWNSGRLEQWGTITGSVSITEAWGAMFVGRTSKVITYPIEFVNVPTLTQNVYTTTNNSCWGVNYETRAITSTTFKVYDLMRATSSTNVGYVCHWTAIGRWKK